MPISGNIIEEKKESIDSIFHYHLATEAQRAEILKPQDYI